MAEPKPGDHGRVTLAIVNARVWTANARRPWADAVAVRGESLAVVGSGAEVRKVAGDARVVDARGALLVPGALGTLVDPRLPGGRAAILERGGAADFVLLDRVLPDASPDSLAAARVRLLIVAGRVEVDEPALDA